ncbi:hypothetical protein [Acaryochloris sp. CCMEE 5410]|uniref:hypothetical protein n=1 Tax=Acaryochloris sp. CCMEE 5410 TaxID=310037 RepID=UPI00024844EE|nr:hypothetical protein [Acaryochloris sp. CCMEE 5410]KAI9129746.1 hypothetical protein ON05_033215 [Acaryochloris sp. CCMEE 5410]
MVSNTVQKNPNSTDLTKDQPDQDHQRTSESPKSILKRVLEIFQIVELRPGETIERIEEMVGVWLDRERVSRVWG